jgi:hypothetical protein
MARHQESAAKQSVRLLLRDACDALNRGSLTYLGLPAEEARDVLVLGSLLENVICVDDKKAVLDETRRSIAGLALRERKFIVGDMWEYLHSGYPAEPLLADVTHLDFYGGGLSNVPFEREIQGLRSYFAKHARHPNRAFVLAWFYMPRDKGPEPYITACKKCIPGTDLSLLENASGMWVRTLAIRLLIRQSLAEHGMSASVFQHVLYKRSMNTLIVVYSKGLDPNCTITVGSPDSILVAPVVSYDGHSAVPNIIAVP